MSTANYYKMDHEYVCGVDLHSKMIYICIIGKDHKVLVHKSIKNNNLEEFARVLKPYIGKIVVAAESCFPYYWLFDYCELTLGVPFILGHALYMKHIHGSKSKNDKIDSLKIAKLVMSHMFPLAHCCSKETRHLRGLMRQRTSFVQERTGLLTKVKIHSYQSNYGDIGAITDKKIRDGIIAEIFEDENQRFNVEITLDMASAISEAIEKTENQVRSQIKILNPEYFKLLNDIHGFDLIIPATIILEIDNIDRFPSVKNFISYCRLVKCSHESAGKKLGYGNSKIGNPQLRHIFGEAAVLLTRFNPEIKAYLDRLTIKYGKGKSLSILAHKVARAIYQVLKKKEPFNMKHFLST